MKKAFIINAHQEYPFSQGQLNNSVVEKIIAHLTKKGFEIKTTTMKDTYRVEEEVEKHLWADVIILQTPVNWMGTPWTFKKYIDEVYTTGMMGQLCDGDGRTTKEPKKNYGNGGKLRGKKYMLSLTFNAPKEAFNDKSEYLFQGKSEDDLFLPQHMNFRFFGMEGLPTFACYDVMKNPEIESDFQRLEKHLNENFS